MNFYNMNFTPGDTPKPDKKVEVAPPQKMVSMDELEDIEEVDLEYIIENKPKAKVVREFMKYNLDSIISEEDLLFRK